MKELINKIAYRVYQATLPPITEEGYCPAKRVELTILEVRRILRARFPKGTLYLADMKYYACSYDDVAYFLAQDETNRSEYISEAYDCDDFARRLYGQFSIPNWSGLCLGLVWTDKHALNLMITEDKEVLFIEPQSDKISENLANWQGSTIRFVVM